MTDPRLRSIYPIYMAMAQGKLTGFTVPAFNLRGMTEDLSAGIFHAAQNTNTALFVLEIARSEMQYTGQPPHVFVERVLRGADRVGWDGPIFLQGDHYQDKVAHPGFAKEGEIASIEKLIDESFTEGIFNIDIDASTLVDLSLPHVLDQQKANGEVTAHFTRYIREHQPDTVTVSIGGEIGHIGDENSTEEDLDAFMQVFLSHHPQSLPGISKVSVQTGTSHGGKVSPDGTVEKMEVDFAVLQKLGEKARLYGMAGAVQHGASTLPPDELEKFPHHMAAEIHLATGWQNMIYNHPDFPQSLRDDIHEWLHLEKRKDRKPDETDVQFYYRTRKYAWGAFRSQFDKLPRSFHTAIQETMNDTVRQVFSNLRVAHTVDMAKRFL